jgi:methionyl-tRNA formyltransferase
MRMILLASGEFAIPTFRWLVQSPNELLAVVSQPPRPSGRGRRLSPTPVQSFAEEHGAEVLAFDDINAADVVARLAAMQADLGLVIAFGQKLRPAVLGAFRWGCINLHASLLPKYRGAAPINWAVLDGEEDTGVTVFRIVERMDAGPVLVTRWTSIKPEETAGELHDRLAGIGVDAVRSTLDLYSGGEAPPGTPQNDSAATRAPKLKKEHGIIAFDRPARQVARHILAMTPWPGATTRFEGKDGRWESLAMVRARPAETPDRPDVPPGVIDARRYVAVADGFLEVLEVKPSSGRIMTWMDYVNGRHVTPGDRFTRPE